MQRLQRVDQDARDVISRPQDLNGRVIHLLEQVDVTDAPRIADAGLHAVPPAVIGAAELHDVRSARVIPREADRLHHRLGARHVERHLVQARDLAQAPRIVDHERVW